MFHEREEWEDVTVSYHHDDDHPIETWSLEDFSDIAPLQAAPAFEHA